MEPAGVFMLMSIRHLFSLLEVEIEDIKVESEEFETYYPSEYDLEDDQKRNCFMLYSHI